MKPWIAKTSDGKHKIEKIPCPNPGSAVDLSRPDTGVMHTTEGNWDSAMAVFKQHYAPHFIVGPHRIAQLVPLGIMAAALENAAGGVETNRWARVQIEVCGFSKTKPYSFDAATSATLASLLATVNVEAAIPLTRPYPDQMPPQPWATESFPRRHDGKWGKVAGWYGHVEVPENSHWDPGALIWGTLLVAAVRALPKKPATERPFSISLQDDKGQTTILQAKKACVLTVDGKSHHLFKDKIVGFEGKRV